MTNVQSFLNLFNALKVKHTFKRHWNDYVDWGMGGSIEIGTKKSCRIEVKIVNFFTFVFFLTF